MTDFLKKYGYAPDREKINGIIERIASNLESIKSEKVVRSIIEKQSLNTLKTNDTVS